MLFPAALAKDPIALDMPHDAGFLKRSWLTEITSPRNNGMKRDFQSPARELEWGERAKRNKEETAMLRRQEFYISHDELLLVSSSRPVSRKDQHREGEERQ